MRSLIAGAGWKMNIGAQKTLEYASQFLPHLEGLPTHLVDIFVLPPFTSLESARKAFEHSPIRIGGQNMHWAKEGNWTGEISSEMLIEAGCHYVELAHAERLQHFGETYDHVNRKLQKALEIGLTPILCLGETEKLTESAANSAIAEQIVSAFSGSKNEALEKVILAYEPRWAIGAHEAATPIYIGARHAFIRSFLRDRFTHKTADSIRIIYGGSVTPDNAQPIISLPEVDGLFVGRSAWKPEGFFRIVKIVLDEAICRAA